MDDSSLKKEVVEKLTRHLDSSYVIISIGDLRELIPELYKIVVGEESPKKLNPEPKPKLMLPCKKLIEDDEIIPLNELEKRLIKAALEKTKGDVELTAKETGISERNLYRKFKEYNIDYNEYKESSKNSK